MSKGNRDRVQVFEAADESPSGRLPNRFIFLGMGLLLGMAVGVLFTPSGPSTGEVTGSSVTLLSQPRSYSPVSTTAMTDPSVTVEGLEGKVRVLESELERASGWFFRWRIRKESRRCIQ